MTPQRPWVTRSLYVVATAVALTCATPLVGLLMEVFLPDSLRSFVVQQILGVLVCAYISVLARHRWPPTHWCFLARREDELVVLYDLHHIGLIGRGATEDDAFRDVRRRYYRGRLL